MHKLTALPNIGNVNEQRLNEIGIKTPEELYAMGSKEAFLRIRANDPTACINVLRSLEGAIQGVRWHHLTDEKKEELLHFYEEL